MMYFILGIAFYGLAMPIAESIASLIVTFFEFLKGKLTVKMVKMQEEIGEKETTYAIGFEHMDDYVPEDDDWEDDE